MGHVPGETDTGGKDQTKIVNLRLASVIADEAKRLGSFDQLAKEIKEVTGGVIDRRKLKRLTEGVDVSIRLKELVALDAYFGRLGEGLSEKPLFDRPGILEALGRSGEVLIFYATYPHDQLERTDIIHWDIESVAEVIRDINRYGSAVHLEIEKVMNLPPGQRKSRAELERWRRHLLDDGPSLVSIGSPRACHASEYMLAEMFGTVSYVNPAGDNKGLPFQFAWPPHGRRKRSSFTIGGRDLRRLAPEFADKIRDKNGKAEVLKIGNEILGVDTSKPGWNSYGIIAAQRRRTGKIWLVLAGLSGPLTLATANALRLVMGNMPDQEQPGQHSPVLWCIVEARIERNPALPGDGREIIDHRLLGKPRFWPEK
jgi:hypothetical protein